MVTLLCAEYVTLGLQTRTATSAMKTSLAHNKIALAVSKWIKHKWTFFSHQETKNLGETHRLFSTLRERGRYAYGSGFPFFFTSPLAVLAWYSVPGVTELP